MPKYAKIRLSPSTLNLFKDCPRCFWLDKNKGIKRPFGIFPSLPGGMDSVIKVYFDKYRLKDELPPEINGKVNGKLFQNLAKLEAWRSWRKTELLYEYKPSDAILSGALDDCLVEDNCYIPLDYKTRGYPLADDPRKYYQTQLDCYTLILNESGYKTKGLAYLAYYWPLEVQEEGIVKFHVEPIKIETSVDSAKKIFMDALNTLSSDIPQASPQCEYCNLVTNRTSQNKENEDKDLFEGK